MPLAHSNETLRSVTSKRHIEAYKFETYLRSVPSTRNYEAKLRSVTSTSEGNFTNATSKRENKLRSVTSKSNQYFETQLPPHQSCHPMFFVLLFLPHAQDRGTRLHAIIVRLPFFFVQHPSIRSFIYPCIPPTPTPQNVGEKPKKKTQQQQSASSREHPQALARSSWRLSWRSQNTKN